MEAPIAPAAMRWHYSRAGCGNSVSAARQELAEIIHDALSALVPFGDNANSMRETAKYFADRQN